MSGAAQDVWDAIEGQHVALLTTLHGDRIVTRPMAPHPDREAGLIRFITKLDSDKAGDIGSSGPVNIGYADPGKNTYLSVSGIGHVAQDRETLRKLWSPWAEAWLPQGPDAPDVALIVVDPDEATLWDATSSKLLSAFEHLRAAVTGGKPHVGTMETVKL